MCFFHHWTYDHFSQFDRSGLEFVQRPQHVLINFQIKWVKTSVLTINKIVQGTVCLEGKSWAVDSTQAQFFCRLFVKLFTMIAFSEAEIVVHLAPSYGLGLNPGDIVWIIIFCFNFSWSYYWLKTRLTPKKLLHDLWSWALILLLPTTSLCSLVDCI